MNQTITLSGWDEIEVEYIHHSAIKGDHSTPEEPERIEIIKVSDELGNDITYEYDDFSIIETQILDKL